MTIGQVFGAFGELRPTDRFVIAGLVRPPFEFFPVTNDDFARLPVVTDPTASATFLELLEAAVAAVLDGPLAGWPLGRLVPGVASLPHSIETATGVTNRLVAIVRSHGRRTWAELSPLTIGEIRAWHGAGRTMIARLVRAAAQTALRAAQTSQLTLAFHTVERVGPALALEACLAGLPDPRGRVAFEVDDLRIDRASNEAASPTHELIGLGHDWMRRLKYDARDHVRAQAAADATLEATISRLAEHLGEVVDLGGIADALAALDLPGLSDPAGLLAVWLAGPYVPVPGYNAWRSPHPAEVVRATTGLVASSGGVHAHDALIGDLTDIGINAASAERWLASQRVRIAEGLVVLVAGRIRDVAARVLEAMGRPMSSDELHQWMPAANNVTSTLSAELRRQPLFVETGPDRWELAEWGGKPSGHLVHIDVPVTENVVDGHEADGPIELAALLGIRAGVPLKLSTRFGPLVMTYDGRRVVRGSARPVVLASGAAIGDVLSFVVDPRSHAVQVTVVATQTSGESP